MSEERNYRYELYQAEKENRELREYIKELQDVKNEYYRSETTRHLKIDAVIPSLQWSVCLTFSVYIAIILIKQISPDFSHKIIEYLSYFEFFGVGCAFYFLVYWLKIRKI